jgi:hypothetical protein
MTGDSSIGLEMIEFATACTDVSGIDQLGSVCATESDQRILV